MTFQQFTMQLMSGLSMGMGLFVVSFGLVFVFGALKILNFSHGSLYMLGAYMVYTLVSHLHSIPGHFWVALILAPVFVAIFGGVLEVVAIRPTYGKHVLYQLLLTFGLIWIIDDLCKLVWGPGFYSIFPPRSL